MNNSCRFLLPALAAMIAGCSRQPEAPAPAGAATSNPSRTLPAQGKIELTPLAARTPLPDGAPMYEEVPPSYSGVTFQPDFDPMLHEMSLMRLNAGGGICTADFTGDGQCDFYVTSPTGGGALYQNLGSFKFRDITAEAGIKDPVHWSTGAQGVDVDNDGDMDLFVCGYRCPSKLWINDGKGRFTDKAKDYALDMSRAGMTMAWGDTDNDGWLDAYYATTGFPPGPEAAFRTKMVDRDGRKVPTIPPELEEFWELLYLPGDRARNVPAAQKDHLLRQSGGKFQDITASAGISGPWFTLSAVFWDYDADNRPDLYISNDYTGPDRLYRNNGGNTFTESLAAVIPHTPWFSMGADVGDLDGDGLLDLITSDMAATSHYRDKVMMGNMEDSAWFLDWAEPRQFMRNAVYLNSGTGRMLEAAFLLGLAGTDWTWTPRIEDYDNDGHPDVFITNGVTRDMMNSDLNKEADSKFAAGTPEYAKFWREQPVRKEKNIALRNTGDLKFDKVSAEWGLDREGVTFGAATADFDNDGALDLAVANLDVPAGIYRNRTPGNAIEVRLKGTASNSHGLGATVTAITLSGQKMTRYVTTTRGFLSASDPLVHIGLGKEEKATLTIKWPSGCVQHFPDIPANHLAVITEGGENKSSGAPPTHTLFQNSEALAALRHTEAPYDDFAREPLLPNKQSVYGPGLAFGDLNSDGRDDIWLAGPAGSPGQLMLGAAAPATPPALIADKPCEDQSALIFDADSDGDHDLYVVSGGNECTDGGLELRDRLYLNDGKANLTPAPKDTLPDERISGSIIAAADFDRDGDLDLFTGTRQTPGQYPKAPPSTLLINNAGKFTPIPLPLGMVTSALWTDADGDSWPDLLVTIDWGSPRLLRNVSGKLEDITETAGLSPLTGWWNGLASADFDHDGDIDYAITNFGLNTKYKATPQKPELLFAGDFDNTGKLQIVEAKYEGDILRPRRGLSCSSTAMPFIRKKLPTFHTFASATLSEVYPPETLEHSIKLTVTELQSGILLNDGKAHFTFRPLPRLAQISPAFGIIAADLTGDAHPDLVLAQNFFGPQRETGRMDGGLSLLLTGDGKGGFHPMPPHASGITVPQDARSLTLADINTDGSPDLIFGINNGPVRALTRSPGASFLRIRLKDKHHRPATGARITLRAGTLPLQTAELHAGGSYLTTAPQELWFTAHTTATATVRWPDGTTTEHQITGPDALIEQK